jgi:hypothetical protein
MEDWNKNIADAKSVHPIAYGAGAVTGTLAPMAIPGVGAAMKAAPMAAGAALGAANSVGNTDVVKDPEKALKQGVEGGLIGGAIGKLMPTGEKTAEELTGFANRKAVQALNLRPGMLGIPEDELENLGSFAHDAGLVEGSTQERLANTRNLLGQTGAQIGDFGAGSQPLKDASPYINALQEEAENSSKFFGREGNADFNMYRQGISNLQTNGRTFDELQALKKAYGEKAFDATGNVSNPAAAKIYGQIKDAMKSIVEGSPTEYQDAMTTYGKLKDIESGLTTQLQQEQARGVQAKGFGMVGKMAGMFTGVNPPMNAGLAAALAPAHPFMALGALTPIATNPQAMSSLARTAAEVAPKVAQGAELGTIDTVTSKLINAIHTNPQSLGKFAKPLMQAAQTGGRQGVAATHYLLASQYPEYNEMMMEAGNHLVKEGTVHAIHSQLSVDEGTK